jgi:hypothetical protein
VLHGRELAALRILLVQQVVAWMGQGDVDSDAHGSLLLLWLRHHARLHEAQIVHAQLLLLGLVLVSLGLHVCMRCSIQIAAFGLCECIAMR